MKASARILASCRMAAGSTHRLSGWHCWPYARELSLTISTVAAVDRRRRPAGCKDALRAEGVRARRGFRCAFAATTCSQPMRTWGRCRSQAALEGGGADVVVTGRCADSALALGILMHEFRWRADEYDRLAAGGVAGRVLECGAQGAGGLHTDWERVPDWANIGYPIAECRADGSFVLTKPPRHGRPGSTRLCCRAGPVRDRGPGGVPAAGRHGRLLRGATGTAGAAPRAGHWCARPRSERPIQGLVRPIRTVIGPRLPCPSSDRTPRRRPNGPARR